MEAIDFCGDLNKFLSDYQYQTQLTLKLDSLEQESFTQETINEIVLWKVNRYAHMSVDVLDSLDDLKTLPERSHRKGKSVLEHLLTVNGVDLPMASTILRFRNPNVFQIIDQHAYRAVYDQKYRLYSASPTHKKVSVYFDYLDKLGELCEERGLCFKTVDRLLYEFDRQRNGKL